MTVKKGTDNIRNRLTEDQVLTIYTDEVNTQNSLALRYGVSQSTINHIKKKYTWAWLTDKYDDGRM